MGTEQTIHVPIDDDTLIPLEDRGTAVTLDDDHIDAIVEALKDEQHEKVQNYLDELTAKDTAELLSKISLGRRYQLLEHHLESLDPEAFVEMDDDLRTVTLEVLVPEQVAAILSELDSDDAVEVIDPLDPLFQKHILRYMSAKDRQAVEEGLTYPEDSAGRLMDKNLVAIPQFWTVGKTIDYLRLADEELPDDFFDIFVIDPLYRIVGEIPLAKIVRSRRSDPIKDLLSESTHPIPADMDQEDVAMVFRREGLVSAPVVDEQDRLIGMITIDDVVAVIDEEAEEDILLLAGVDSTDMYRDVLTTARSRFSWLAINLLTAILASIVISFFDATIQQIVALAVLMPIVASMGGNAGTQTLTIAVRALATKELSRTNMWRMIGKETFVGFLNGAGFAIIAGLLAYLWFGDILLGGVIAMAMIVNLIAAGLFGISIPLICDKMDIDPALASSVFLTTVTDIIGFFAFLGLAALVLV